ncbi:MAG: aminopeptidase [Chloroflexi bacterium]|nr:aminopeptidase [Chloroflexota bacterium]
MTVDNEIREGARNAVQVCMNVQAQDRVFVLTDNITLGIGQTLADEAAVIGADVKLARLEEYASRPITYAPEELIAAIKAFAPTVTLMAATSQKGEIAFRMALFVHLRYELEVRHAHMPGITPRLMREGMRANYHQVYDLTMQVYERVQQAKVIHVISPKGTDLIAHFAPKLKWVPCHGQYHEQGEWGNLPEGEVFTCPAAIEGTAVADVLGDYFSSKYSVLAHPVTFEIADSLVQQVTCDDKGIQAEVWDYLNSAKNGRRVGEFAIGTNTAVTELSGNLLQDEKIPGVHIAFGNPYPHETGADWSSSIHVDVIVTECNIKVDGKLVMEGGEFRFPQ